MSAVVTVQSGTAGSTENWSSAALEEARSHRASWQSGALLALQSHAEASWKKILFPTPRHEAWKYTNTDAIAKGDFVLVQKAVVAPALSAPLPLEELAAFRLIFIDGSYAPALSSADAPKGVSVRRLSELCVSQDEELALKVGSSGAHTREPFAALATSLMSDGVVISVTCGAVVETPLHIINLVTSAASGRVMTPRLTLDVGDGAIVKVVESYVSHGGERYLNLPICEIFAAPAAIVDYYRVQDEAATAYHVSFLAIEQGAGSAVNSHLASFGAAQARNNVEVSLKGSGAHSSLNGVTVLADDQHVDNATSIHHIEPSAESREHFKGVYAGRSKGVFSGLITVEPAAQKTNAFQSNQALLLSPDASIDSQPQLKIWADDVKCTHGATVGQLDNDALFYLRSRGIGAEAARNFLVHAFASEVLTSLRIEPLRRHIEGIISTKLATPGRGV